MINYDEIVKSIAAAETFEDFENLSNLLSNEVNSLSFNPKEAVTALNTNETAWAKAVDMAYAFFAVLSTKPYYDGRNAACVEFARDWARANIRNVDDYFPQMNGKRAMGASISLLKIIEEHAENGEEGCCLGECKQMYPLIHTFVFRMHPTLQQNFASFCSLIMAEAMGEADKWHSFPFI